MCWLLVVDGVREARRWLLGSGGVWGFFCFFLCESHRGIVLILVVENGVVFRYIGIDTLDVN